MTIEFVSVSLEVRTLRSTASFGTRFSPGLNVVDGHNSWGKSTLLQSLVFGLALEGAISASQQSPLGEAMSSVIDLDGSREAVVESSVTVTLRNDHGNYLRTRRFAKSPQHELHLVQTWEAPSEAGLSSAERRDYFARERGGATHELGFHRMLEDFVGWTLPDVFGFDGEDIKLYFEVVLPLFYIEQKHGWAGIAPRVPTHYRIRNPLRRATEFVLGLSRLACLKEHEGLKTRLAALSAEQTELSRELTGVLKRNQWTLNPPLRKITELEIGSDDVLVGVEGPEWTLASTDIDRLATRVSILAQKPVASAAQHTEVASAALRDREEAMTLRGATLRRQKELLSEAASEVATLEDRVVRLAANRERLRDVQRLTILGSDLGLSLLADATCPTCSQSLDSHHVASGVAMDVASNLALLTSESDTLTGLLESARSTRDRLEQRVDATSAELAADRHAVRALKDELTGRSDAPSVAQIRERIELESALDERQRDLAAVRDLLQRIEDCAISIARVRQRQQILRRERSAGADGAKIASFRSRYRALIDQFGITSLPVSEITIGSDSLLPEHDGFELAFDIRQGMSASDSIRSKWAYFVGLAEATSSDAGSNPLGILMIDEPRQQEADFGSVRALYGALATAAASTQVIVASSASDADLTQLLEGLAANRIRGYGARMLRTDSPS